MKTKRHFITVKFLIETEAKNKIDSADFTLAVPMNYEGMEIEDMQGNLIKDARILEHSTIDSGTYSPE